LDQDVSNNDAKTRLISVERRRRRFDRRRGVRPYYRYSYYGLIIDAEKRYEKSTERDFQNDFVVGGRRTDGWSDYAVISALSSVLRTVVLKRRFDNGFAESFER